VGFGGSASPGDDWTVRHVGCTGSRDGITDTQRKTIRRVLSFLFVPDSVLHHGDCVGADEEIAHLGYIVGFRFHSHPPSNPRFRAFIASDAVSPTAPYLSRNWHIVRASDVLVAAPKGSETLSSGTWVTVRYSRDMQVPAVLCWPDGSVSCELHKVVHSC
jgi:hypothetical protein